MRICLAGPPTVEHAAEDAFREEESPRDIADRIPLGLLTLAAGAEQRGHAVSVVDLNREFLDFTQLGRLRADFVEFAAARIANDEFDLLGLGTMCSSYPTTLRIAAEVKKLRSASCIVLGGPQASVVDTATLEHFPAIDIIVRGEADATFPALCDVLAQAGDLKTVPGISFRSNGRVIANHAAPPVLDLDALPFPAYEKIGGIEGLKILPIEIGRGCPFSCTFCSTNDFFRRKFRLRSPEAVLSHMRLLNERYRATTFILVHDMFTVDRKRVVEFCQAMIDSGFGYEWTCSARTDCIDRDLMRLMAEAGCRGLFFGVETGSARMQRIIDKDLGIDQAREAVESAAGLGIDTTASMIIGFPEEEIEDVRATLDFLADAARLDHLFPQIGLLSPLARTPVLDQYRDALYFDPIFPDFAYSAWFPDARRIEMVRAHRDIFPNFYALPTRVSREYLFELKMFFYAVFLRFRWLMVAAHQESGGIVAVFDRWREWRQAPQDLIGYYVSLEFKNDFIQFVRTRLITTETVATHLLADAHAILMKVLPRIEARTGNPELQAGISVVELPGSIEFVVDALKHRRRVDRAELRPTPYLARSDAKSNVLVPLESLAARVLKMCDGTRDAEDILRLATGSKVSTAVASAFFDQLHRNGVVTMGTTQAYSTQAP